MAPPPPPLRLTIDRGALADNWRALDRLSGLAQAGAAVKADAYGLGVDIVVPTLRDAGASTFFVAHWSEVAAVARHVPPSAIAVLHGPVTAQEAAYGVQSGAQPVINSPEQARLWCEAGGGPCHLMIDTGINRLGLSPEQLGDAAVARLEIDMVLSHLASADEESPLNDRQRSLFAEIARSLPARRRSLANSAGIALGPSYAFDVTRPGLALYGGISRRELAPHIRQVIGLQAQVIQLRELSPGDAVGYNATFVADRPMRAATIALGYADGFLRSWSGRAVLRCGNAELPLIGRVSMDMVVADASAAPTLRAGDWIEIPYFLPDAAEQSGLSQYELLTLLGRRFARFPLRKRSDNHVAPAMLQVLSAHFLGGTGMATGEADGTKPTVIKKYANRRLYNTSSSSYITLDDLSRMTREGTDFQVIDAKSGNDITHAILTQIIMEEESTGEQLLPISFLRQLIAMYGNSMQTMMPQYLEATMENFRANQRKLQESWSGTPGTEAFAKLAETNMAMFQAAAKAFLPPAQRGNPDAPPAPAPGAAEPSDLDALKAQMEAMQKKLNDLGNGTK